MINPPNNYFRSLSEALEGHKVEEFKPRRSYIGRLFASKAFLSYDATIGWKIRNLNTGERLLRWTFGCLGAYHDTHKATIKAALLDDCQSNKLSTDFTAAISVLYKKILPSIIPLEKEHLKLKFYLTTSTERENIAKEIVQTSTDQALILLALSSCPSSGKFLTKTLQKDEEFIKTMITANSQNQELLTHAVEWQPSAIQHVAPALQAKVAETLILRHFNDKEFIKKIINHVPSAVKFASDALLEDGAYIRELIAQNYAVFGYLPKVITQDSQFIKTTKVVVLEQLEHPQESTTATTDTIILLAKKDLLLLDKLPQALTTDPKFIERVEEEVQGAEKTVEKWKLENAENKKQFGIFDNQYAAFLKEYKEAPNFSGKSQDQLDKKQWADPVFRLWAKQNPLVVKNYIVYHRNPLMSFLRAPGLWECLSQDPKRGAYLKEAFAKVPPAFSFRELDSNNTSKLKNALNCYCCSPDLNPSCTLIQALKDEQIKPFIFSLMAQPAELYKLFLLTFDKKLGSSSTKQGVTAFFKYILSQPELKQVYHHMLKVKFQDHRYLSVITEYKGLNSITAFDGGVMSAQIPLPGVTELDSLSIASTYNLRKMIEAVHDGLQISPSRMSENLAACKNPVVELLLKKHQLYSPPDSLDTTTTTNHNYAKNAIEACLKGIMECRETSSWFIQECLKLKDQEALQALKKLFPLLKPALAWNWSQLPSTEEYAAFMQLINDPADLSFSGNVPLSQYSSVKKMLGSDSSALIKFVSLERIFNFSSNLVKADEILTIKGIENPQRINYAVIKQFKGLFEKWQKDTKDGLDVAKIDVDIFVFIQDGHAVRCTKPIDKKLFTFIEEHPYQPLTRGDENADFKVICVDAKGQQKEFPVHSAILGRISKPLSVAFSEKFNDSKVWKEEDFSPYAMEIALDYMYAGKKAIPSDLDFATLIDLREIFTKWEVKEGEWNVKESRFEVKESGLYRDVLAEALDEQISILITLGQDEITKKEREHFKALIKLYDIEISEDLVAWANEAPWVDEDAD